MHNSITTGTNDSPSLYGTADYGDYGVLSSGESSNGISEPPADTPFAPYYGLQMLTHLEKAGDQMVTASSNQSLVTIHAVKQANGKLAVLLINKDPSTTYVVGLKWSGYIPAANPRVSVYEENSAPITTVHEHGFLPDYVQIILPYSLTALVVSPLSHH